MSAARRLLLFLFFAAAALTSLGSSITFNGPFGPGHDSGVSGNQLVFDIQNAILTQPMLVMKSLGASNSAASRLSTTAGSTALS